MRTPAFLRNVPILAGQTDESLERMHADFVITPRVEYLGLMDWRALPHVVDLGRRAAREALGADPESLSRLGS
jgi:predicted acylesterase/phospholipase RssA